MSEIDRQFVTFSEVADETNDNKSNDDDYYTDDDLCAPSEAEMFSNNECSDNGFTQMCSSLGVPLTSTWYKTGGA